MRVPGRDLVKGIAGLGCLVLLLVAPPAALVQFVGWPLPTSIPDLDAVSAATRSGVDDMVVVKVLAVLAWLLWIQIAAAAMVETAAVLRGCAARRAPVLPGVQLAVGRLVAIAALVLSGLGSPRVTPAPMVRLAAAVAQPAAPPGAPPDIPPTPSQVGNGRVPVDQGGASYVVQRNDSWWAIAERVMGDGQRWKELRSLNAGRTMADGTVIDGRSEVVRPGWRLILPAEAGGGIGGPGTGGAGEEVAVERGDNLWLIAGRHLAQAGGNPAPEDRHREYWAELIEANRDRLADPGNPNRIYAGQLIRMPPVNGQGHPGGEAPVAAAPAPSPRPAPVPPDVPPPVTPATAPAPAATTAPARPAADTPLRPVTDPASAGDRNATGEQQRIPVRLLGAAGTLLAVGVSAAVGRRRRRRQSQLPRRAQAPVPPPEFDDLRSELVMASDADRAPKLQRALQDVATALAGRASGARPRLVQVNGSRLEVLLSEPVLPAPAPWSAEASGAAWVLKGEPRSEGAGAATPCPGLVSVGAHEEGTELYLDLEAEGVVTLNGEAAAIADVARSWILELATSPLASGVSVTVVGDDLAPGTSGDDRVRCCGSWEEVADDALAWADQSVEMMTASRWPTPFAGRMSDSGGGDASPLVLVVAGRPDDDRFERLCTTILEHQVTVVVVVVGGEVDGSTRVEVGAGLLRIPSLGLECEAQSVTVVAAEQIDEFLEDAGRLPAQLSLMPLPVPDPPVVVGSPQDEYRDPPYEVLVRFLGDISVVGAKGRLKPKQAAVLAYIASHAPVASERVEDAVWVTPTASRRKRLANTVSECRNAIGASHLPLASDGKYRIGPAVVTDLELFDRRLAYAAEQDDHAAIATLRGALELVEGPVFTYRNAERGSFVWVDVENWISTWELKVTDTAEDLAQRCLDVEDVDGAVWAARRGLDASHTHTRLTKLLMQAYFAKGDIRAAERVFESHQSALEKLELDDVDGELVEFFQRARHGNNAATS